MSAFSIPPRLRAGLVVAVTSAAVVVAGAPMASAAPTEPPAVLPSTTGTPGRYVVTLTAKPIASYAGGVAGMAATRPEDGRKVDVAGADAQRYRGYLQRAQRAAAAKVGATPLNSYSVALNGFAADLTADQAQRLERTAGVLSVTKDTLHQALDDSNNVDYLKLSGSKGVWKSLGGTSKAGKGVVVGVIDTGVWPESKSFSGSALKTKKGSDPYKVGTQVRFAKGDGTTFVGTCQTGEDFTATDCNTKLISARYFGDAWLKANPPADRSPDEYVSPRDGDEHGTHTASTAAGNADVTATFQGRSIGKISGVAPAAKVAVYKALWEGRTDAQSGGFTSDLVAAIDAAVADGVDVINYSVGSSSESALVDPTQIAFLNAASAGVFVAASAGNSGPGASTLDNTAPWLTTVAASSIAPRYGTVALGNGQRYPGVSNNVVTTLANKALVAGADAKTSAATTSDASFCLPGTLDPAKVAGKVVACDRGNNARVEKSDVVKAAGGVGMVLLNLTENSLDGDAHAVPTIILNPPGSTAVKAYATGNPSATVTLSKGNSSTTKIAYPEVAGFSSRGPSLANGSDLLKPDVAAPGVNILAAVAPNTGTKNEKFGFLSGTSMAAPQVAGLAALYFGKHPKWSPMAVKSALMTTAGSTVDSSGRKNTDAYAQGAGEVTPKAMFNPGVVLDSADEDWLAYLEGQGYETGSGVDPIDPSDYNTPSIAVGALVNSQTVTRRVTAVRAGTYAVKASVPGFKSAVNPTSLKFTKAGQTKTVRVQFTRTGADLGEAAFGSVELKSSKASARLPVALVPVLVDAPDEVRGTGTSGSTEIDVKAGVSGPLTLDLGGLAAAAVQTGTVKADDAAAPEDFPVTVAAGTKLARFDVDAPDTADVDLVVYRVVDGKATAVGISATGAADESVTLVAPDAGAYVVRVAPYADPPGTDETAFTLSSYLVGAKQDNFAVDPSEPTVTAGRRTTLTASWQGLTAGTDYLGWVGYPDGTGTVVSVTG